MGHGNNVGNNVNRHIHETVTRGSGHGDRFSSSIQTRTDVGGKCNYNKPASRSDPTNVNETSLANLRSANIINFSSPSKPKSAMLKPVRSPRTPHTSTDPAVLLGQDDAESNFGVSPEKRQSVRSCQSARDTMHSDTTTGARFHSELCQNQKKISVMSAGLVGAERGFYEVRIRRMTTPSNEVHLGGHHQ